jgi:hypothetical protein
VLLAQEKIRPTQLNQQKDSRRNSMNIRCGFSPFKALLVCMGTLLAGVSYASVPDALYHAAATKGGPGIAGCTGAKNCVVQPWGVDLNRDTGFAWHVQGGTGGIANIYVRIAVPTWGTRAMRMTVNGVTTATIRADFTNSPREKGGSEMGPYTVNLNAGDNVIQLHDSEGTTEFDVLSVRVQDAFGSLWKQKNTIERHPLRPSLFKRVLAGLNILPQPRAVLRRQLRRVIAHKPITL